jgi:hypothetical protein
MIPRLRLRNTVLLLVTVLPIACAKFEAGEGKKQPPPDGKMLAHELTEAERKAAVNLAQGHPTLRKALGAGQRVHLAGVEVHRDKEAEKQEPPHRLARVIHYQPQGDMTILTTVDLTANKIIHTESVAHLPTPLSDEEFKLAEKLALADPAVKKLLGAQAGQATVQGLLSRTESQTDPAFGHRVVHLLFRVGDNYLSARAAVDLTTNQVTLETPQQANQPGHPK